MTRCMSRCSPSASKSSSICGFGGSRQPLRRSFICLRRASAWYSRKSGFRASCCTWSFWLCSSLTRSKGAHAAVLPPLPLLSLADVGRLPTCQPLMLLLDLLDLSNCKA